MMGRLVGYWRLVAFTERRADGSSFDVWGPSPKGYISYTEDGRMSVVFGGSQRVPFKGAWDAVTPEQKAANFEAMVAYSGRYTEHADRVVHHVEVCWMPNWEGRDLERMLTFLPGNRVMLSTPPLRFGRPQPVQDVLVERATAP